MVLAVLLFSLMDAVLKTLAGHYPPLQIAGLRGLTALPLVFAWIQWRGGWGRMKKLRWPLHILRGGLGIVMVTLFTRGVSELPLSAAYTVFFVAPLLITLLSIPMLNERVPKTHWWAIALGFMGVLVAIRPSGSDLQIGFASIGGLAVLGAAACYAVAVVTSRLLSRSDSTESVVLSLMVFIGIGGSLLAAPDWVPIATHHLPLLLALAVTGFLGQLAITEAFRTGQASVLAPFEYTALAWGVGLDWLIWQALPPAHTWLGAAIIIGSGLYLVRREQRSSEALGSTEHP